MTINVAIIVIVIGVVCVVGCQTLTNLHILANHIEHDGPNSLGQKTTSTIMTVITSPTEKMFQIHSTTWNCKKITSHASQRGKASFILFPILKSGLVLHRVCIQTLVD